MPLVVKNPDASVVNLQESRSDIDKMTADEARALMNSSAYRMLSHYDQGRVHDRACSTATSGRPRHRLQSATTSTADRLVKG